MKSLRRSHLIVNPSDLLCDIYTSRDTLNLRITMILILQLAFTWIIRVFITKNSTVSKQRSVGRNAFMALSPASSYLCWQAS